MLLSVEEDGQGLTEDEIVSNVVLLFVAGHETTANMIGNALIALHQHPDQLRLLEQQPALLPRAINECMRYDSSVQFITRMALEDTEAGGIALPKGSIVFMSLGAANRDPGRFADPDRLLIERAESGNRLIAFGGGIHYCLGARLAAMELQDRPGHPAGAPARHAAGRPGCLAMAQAQYECGGWRRWSSRLER